MNAIDMNLVHAWDDADAENRHQTILHDLLTAYRNEVITKDQLLRVDAVLTMVYEAEADTEGRAS